MSFPCAQHAAGCNGVGLLAQRRRRRPGNGRADHVERVVLQRLVGTVREFADHHAATPLRFKRGAEHPDVLGILGKVRRIEIARVARQEQRALDASRLGPAVERRARVELRGIQAELRRPRIDLVLERDAALPRVRRILRRGAPDVDAGRDGRAVGEVAEHRLVAALGHEVERREKRAASVQRGGFELQLVERLDARGLRQSEAAEHGRERDARFVLAIDTGPQRGRHVEWIEITQPAEGSQALAPVERLPAQLPVDGQVIELVMAMAVKIVQRDAAEFRASQGAVIAQRLPSCVIVLRRCPTVGSRPRWRSRTRPGR